MGRSDTIFHHGRKSAPGQAGTAQRPASAGVGQDKDRDEEVPPATIYPGPRKTPAGPGSRGAGNTARTETPQRKASFHVWLEHTVGVELRHLAERKGISISATTNALLKDQLVKSLHEQHDALLEPLVTKALRREQSQQRRLIMLMYLELVRTRRMLVNLLARTKPQRAMDPDTLDRIVDSTMKQARSELFSRHSPFDEETRREILEWLQGTTPIPDGEVGKEAAA